MGIGAAGGLPWSLPGDMAYFKALTSTTRGSGGKGATAAAAAAPGSAAAAAVNAVIMGRRTWESIPERFRPLAGRLNVVLTRGAAGGENAADENAAPASAGAPASATARAAAAALAAAPDGRTATVRSRSLEDALAMLAAEPLASQVETAFVIGGGEVYRRALPLPQCRAVHLTSVELPSAEHESRCDVFFPKLDPASYRLWSSTPPRRDRASGARFSFLVYARVDGGGDEGESGGGGKSGGGGISTGGGGGGAAHQTGGESNAGAVAAGGGNPPASAAAASDPDAAANDPLDAIERALPPAAAGQHAERQYLSLVRELLECGDARPDRTGTGTLSRFGVQHRWDLRHGAFPLLTTKRVFWRGVVEELLWFVRGSTNARELQARGVRIWDGNSSRAFLDARGLGHREEGDLGPVYGFQWRHFGAQYRDMHSDYSGGLLFFAAAASFFFLRSAGLFVFFFLLRARRARSRDAPCLFSPAAAPPPPTPPPTHTPTGQGVDQLADCIRRIRTDPTDRRIVMTAWNPAALGDMALPPCHLMCQVREGRGGGERGGGEGGFRGAERRMLQAREHGSSSSGGSSGSGSSALLTRHATIRHNRDDAPPKNPPPPDDKNPPKKTHINTNNNNKKVLRVRRRAVVPDVPALGRRRTGRPLQHRLVRPAHVHDGAGVRPEAGRARARDGRRARVRQPRRAAAPAAGQRAAPLPAAAHQRRAARDRRVCRGRL